MKLIIRYILPFVAVFAVSCSQDKGAYDYRDINEVEIYNMDDNYTVSYGVGRLHVEPGVRMTMDDPSNTRRFEYTWTIKSTENNMGFVDVDTLGTELIIDMVPSHLAVGTHKLSFRITDRELGTFYFKTVNLQIVPYNSIGFLLIGEDPDGYVDMGMIAMVDDTVVYDNLFPLTNLPPLRGPISLQHTGRTGPSLWLITEEGSYWLDRQTFASSTSNNFYNRMFDPPGYDLHVKEVGPQVKQKDGATGDGMSRYFVTTDNNLWVISQSSGEYFDTPVNVLNYYDPDDRIAVKGEILYMMRSGYFNNFVWYDGVGERFMFFQGAYTNKVSYALSDEYVEEDGVNKLVGAFPWEQRDYNRTYIYGENTHNSDGSVNGNAFALLQDKTDQSLHIYMINTNTSSGSPTKTAYYEVPAEAAGLATAEMRAFASTRTVVFYVEDNKVKALDYNPNFINHYEFDLWDGNEITMMKFDLGAEPQKDYLYIATYDPATGGAVQKYQMPTDWDEVRLEEIPTPDDWKSFGMKITNMHWRGVN